MARPEHLSHHLLPSAYWEAGSEVEQLGLELGILVWDVGVPSDELTTVPSTHPPISSLKIILFLFLRMDFTFV